MADESSCKFSDRAKNTETCSHLSVVERYYTPKYKTGFGTGKDEDHCVLTHSNKVCMVTLAPSHPLIRDKRVVKSIDFQVDKNTNRLSNKVEGKSKKGAHVVTATSPLCHVTCEDGETFTVYACMRGHLVEVNSNLVDQPQLLIEKPQTDGYVGIILSKLKDYETEMARLLTDEQYHQEINKRTSDIS